MINTAKLVAADFIHKLNYPLSFGRTLEGTILMNIRRKGYFVLENFIDPKHCDELRVLADNFIFENMAKVLLESNGSDQRVYGIDRFEPIFNIAKIERLSNKIFRKFSFPLKPNHFTLLGLIKANPENLGSGSGWHQDSPFSHQFKSILYLTDVHNENGPFQYVPKTHRFKMIYKIKRFLKMSLNKYRFTNKEIELLKKDKIIDSPVTFTGNKGTLIFVDTRGLHRGAPLKKASRYALTRYHFALKNNKFES